MDPVASEIVELALTIVRFVDPYQPGVVEAEFVDATGRSHTFIEKVPIVSVEDLDACSKYPLPGAARCTVLDRSRDSHGRVLVTITTAIPDVIESSEGLSEFIVLETQISVKAARSG